MEKDFFSIRQSSRPASQLLILGVFSFLVTIVLVLNFNDYTVSFLYHHHYHRPQHASTTLSRCRALRMQAGPTDEYHKRSTSDRFVHGTKPVLLQRAKVWTGRKNGTEVIYGDILLDKGLIKSVGHLGRGALEAYGSDLIVIDTKNAWVTPGIIDVHSHFGVSPSPGLDGAQDGNSLHGTAQPWLRSLDGLNTHDSYLLSVSGGVTTSLILPGSANAIGGQAYVIKLRQTKEGSPTSMLLEPPYQINISFPNPNLPPRWRHMKHACGENPSIVYGDTRMDTSWAFREAYNTATQIKKQQDEYCSLALAGKWKGLGELPENLQWEALVDAIRGRVKINIHCYESVDLDNLVRLSNEFKFPIAAFHHASEAYLVPDLLKQTYGGRPAIALFATNSRFKREAYRASEFAPRILAEQGFTVVMKSDHPVEDSRYVLYEAQQAYYYGFPENLAIASVTSNAADVIGMGHRVGYVKEGWDADLVIWDSHPLALGATPSQVIIDGIPQLESPYVVHKPRSFQRTPKVPNFDKEAQEAVKYDGLPPLAPKKAATESVVFTNVKSVFMRASGSIQQPYMAQDETSLGVVVTRNGSMVCFGHRISCLRPSMLDDSITYIDLEGGSITPGFVSFGSPLGLQHIELEPSTKDGNVFDPLSGTVPMIMGGGTAMVHAVDGLLYGSRDALLAYRAGVTRGITAPSHSGFYAGLGVSFSLRAAHKLEEGAVIKEVTGVHVSVKHLSAPSVSTQIATLRRLLLGPPKGAAGHWFGEAKKGRIPLVIEAHSADIIATLIMLKKEVDLITGDNMVMTITGASEAHILARELADSKIGVVLNPPRQFPRAWEDRRILPGPPLTRESAITTLMMHGVVVGLGCEEIWSARNLPFEIAWVAIQAGGRISKKEAIAIGTTNLEQLLGAEIEDDDADLVATRGGDLLEFGSKVVGVLSPARGLVDLVG